MAEELPAGRSSELIRLVRATRFDDLESAWMAAAENDEFLVEDFVLVLDELASQGAAKPIDSLTWLLVTILAERKGAEAALDAARRLIDLFPDARSLRDETAGLYRQVYGAVPSIATLVEMTLLRADIPLRIALVRLEKYLQMPPGTYVADGRRRSPGRVIGVDEARKVLVVSFGDTQRAYDAAAVENLEPGDSDDLRAVVLFDRPRLELLAKENPGELARLVLKAYGPHMSFRDFKAALADVVPGGSWSKWWSAARAEVRRSPLIEMSEGSQPTFFLRSRPLAYEDRARADFDGLRELRPRLLHVLGYLKEAAHDPAAEAGLLGRFAGELARQMGDAHSGDPAAAIACAAVLAQMHRRRPEAIPAPAISAATILGPGADIAALVAAMGDDRLAAAALGHIREAIPDRWPDLYAAAMMGASEEVCEWLADELAAAGHYGPLASVAAEVLRRPEQSMAATFWLWKAAVGGRLAEAFAGVNLQSLTIRFLLAADDFGRRAADDKSRRPLVAQIRSAVAARDGALLRTVLEAADDRQAKDIRAALERNAALTDQVRARSLDIVRKTHPSHFVMKTVEPWEDDAVIYTSQAALRRQEEIYGELVTKKILDNQRAIAAAAEHGDVTENAEFIAALEERDRLAERAGRLQADIARARIVSGAMAAGATVTVGSRVRARSLDTGAEETLIFLGPWDADISKHIYYYRAAMSLAFMGRAAGDTVVLKTDAGERRWEIIEIGPALT